MKNGSKAMSTAADGREIIRRNCCADLAGAADAYTTNKPICKVL